MGTWTSNVFVFWTWKILISFADIRLIVSRSSVWIAVSSHKVIGPYIFGRLNIGTKVKITFKSDVIMLLPEESIQLQNLKHVDIENA